MDDNPNPNLWINKGTFVNFNYPINPPSYGVVTLDGLNVNGVPYSYAPFAAGGADTLTSQPINLSKSKIADSIYLSFFFEPEGNGDYPDPSDSLIVEFYAKGSRDTGWVMVWAHDGYAVDPNLDTLNKFTQVLIPVADSMYLDSFFQFRFRNYATISGNNDHWHLDYVKLDSNRRYNNYDIHDVAITNIPTRPLKKYFHMPWNQYLANASGEMAIGVNYSIYNNWFTGRNVNSGCIVTDYLNSIDTLKNYTASANNVNASSIIQLNLSPSFSIPTTLHGDNFCRHVVNEKFYLNPGVAEDDENDTLNFQQIFTNFFSYDDGTAERAWGLAGLLSKAALEYNLNIPDTLKAIQIHWAHLNQDQRKQLINIIVWQSLDFVNGVTDVVLYSESFKKPIYVDSSNGFTTYVLDTAQILPAGKFYIGFQLLTDTVYLGRDMNNNSSGHLFVNTGLNWASTITDTGAVMMRPMFGNCIPLNTPLGINGFVKSCSNILLYPNPTNDAVHIKMPYTAQWKVSIFNLQGQQIFNQIENDIMAEISLHHASSGAYLIRVMDVATGKIFSDKIIKQ